MFSWAGAGLAGQTSDNRTSVAGRVFEVNDERPVEGARLALSATRSSFARVVFSDQGGGYRLTGLAPGQYELQVSRLGFLPATFDIEIHRIEPVNLSIGLVPLPVALDPVTVDVASPPSALAYLLRDRPTDTRNVISREDIERRAAGAATAQDVVRRIRPGWLRRRGNASLRTTTDIVIYANGVRRGGATALEGIPASAVYEIWFVEALQATLRWGSGHSGSVIHVIMYPPG